MTESAPPLDSAQTWTGRFHDGITAVRHAVEVRLGIEGLEIRALDDDRTELWPYATLTAIDSVQPGEPLVLTRAPEDDARLTLVAPHRYDALLRRAPQLTAPIGDRVRRGAARLGLWCVIVGAVVGAFWFGWPPLADGLAAGIPQAWQARLGARARDALSAHASSCNDPGGMAVLDRLLLRLAQAMDYPEPVAITVVNLPVVNALALPGNQILLFSRLLDEAQTPEEIAGVLAHELGHLAAHHPMRNLVRQSGLGLLFTALSGMSSLDGLAQLALASAYSRQFETEADDRAFATLRAASIGSQGWIDFFTRHDRPGGNWDHAIAYLSTHPQSAARRSAAERLPTTGAPVMSAGDWLVLKTICGGNPRRR